MCVFLGTLSFPPGFTAQVSPVIVEHNSLLSGWVGGGEGEGTQLRRWDTPVELTPGSKAGQPTYIPPLLYTVHMENQFLQMCFSYFWGLGMYLLTSMFNVQ